MNNQENNNVKKITVYVNTIRIHWLVEELQKEGVKEIMVTEFFRPNSQISKFEFLCIGEKVQSVRNIIHTVETCGKSVEHYFSVKETDNIKSIFPFM